VTFDLSCSSHSERDDGVSKEQACKEMNPVLVNVVSPQHFSLPEDPATPVVMFAGGTGKLTFTSVFSVRTHDHVGRNLHSNRERYSIGMRKPFPM
jgi:hypothetical protein